MMVGDGGTSPLVQAYGEPEMTDRKRGTQRPHVLLGASGSVAGIKVATLVQLLSVFADVKVVVTRAAMNFIGSREALAAVQVLTDEDDWREWNKVGDPVLHIELRRWADVFLIAPLSANTLAKLANGLCDNLLSCVARAWDWNRPLLIAPAMNTMMWDSPFTPKHLQVLQDMGAQVIQPIEKKLACGDIGAGALAEPESIAEAIKVVLSSQGWQL